MKPGAKLEPPKVRKVEQPNKILAKRHWVGAALIVLLAILAASWWLRLPPTDGKPVIAVLPFDNLSDNPALDFYARGMTRNLITGLSKLSELEVIGLHTVRVIDPGEFPIEDLGASHVVEGSILRFDGRFQVNTNLVKVESSRSTWSEGYDVDESNFFDL